MACTSSQRQTPASPRRRRRSACNLWQVTEADCFEALPALARNTADAVITDPPYGININRLAWDRPGHLDPDAVPGRRRRSKNPNERLQKFSRAWSVACLRVLKPGGHLAAFAAPRTVHRVTSGLEEAGYEIRDVLMWLRGNSYPGTRVLPDGLGTGLRPAWEPIVLARKPLAGTLTENLAAHGTGAMNIAPCRIALTDQDCSNEGRTHGKRSASPTGRWPANLLLSHAETCTAGLCEPDCPVRALGDRHRFFYCARASRRERETGCERLPRGVAQTYKIEAPKERQAAPVANIHATVKPIDLMRWLVRLLNPTGGLVLDPFAGSGSTGIAAVLEQARFLGIEREAMYVPIARARISHWSQPSSRA